MARCKYCGAEGLVWQVSEHTAELDRWDLMEPEGEYHNCKPENRRKEYERCLKEKMQTDKAVRKHREQNGYL